MFVRRLAMSATIAALSCGQSPPPGGTPPPGGSGAGDANTMSDAPAGPVGPVMVACYTQASPSATCTAPEHCCFSNFSAQHDGMCSTTACAWGTISCDGPEDCVAGQHCCAHAIIDPVDGTTGYTIACQAAACGAAPANQELCHATATCTTGACTSAFGTDNDLPRVLSICQ